MTAARHSLLNTLSACLLIGVGRLAVWLVVLALVAMLTSITLCFEEPLMTPEVAMTEFEVTPQEKEPTSGVLEGHASGQARPAETCFLGFGVLDFTAHPKASPVPKFDKIDVETCIDPGGGAVNMAEAYQLAGGGPARHGVITGADAPGNMLIDMLGSRLINVQRIATAARTRISLLTPRDDRSDQTRIWTERSALDEAATMAHVRTWFSPERRVVLASMTAAQAGFVEQVLDAHAGEMVMMLTRSQCEDRQRTLAFAARCRVQLNDGELETFTGIKGNIIAGINWLRDRGIPSVIVTAGRRGIFAHLRSVGWLYAPAFQVKAPSSSPAKCGDFVLGTFLAGLDRGESAKQSLRIAAAAAAMKAAGIERAGGWQELVAFADQTPTFPFVPDAAPKSSPIVNQLFGAARRLAAPAGYMTAGAALAAAMVRFMTAST